MAAHATRKDIQLSFKMSSSYNTYLFFQFKWLQSYGMEKAMAPHSSTLAWKIPWMEEPGRLQSMGLLKVGHN